MTFSAGDDTNTTQVTTTRNHANITRVELDEIVDLSSGNINLNGVVGLDQGVRVADGAAVVKHKIGNLLWSLADLLDAAQLVLQ